MNLNDRVQETGAGFPVIALQGHTLKRQAFSAAFSAGTDNIGVAVEEDEGTGWITGLARLDSAGSLTVTQIFSSSAGGQAVPLFSGLLVVFCTVPSAAIAAAVAAFTGSQSAYADNYADSWA